MNAYDNARLKARRDAEEILEEFSNGQLPVDPVAIANRMGVECYRTQLGTNVSGLIQKDTHGKPRIYVDIDDGPRRSRFTIAHELGHYADHMWRGGDGQNEFIDRRDGTTNVNEFYANEFAASLLMPEDNFRGLVSANLSNREIANLLVVSEPAVRVRKQTLGL